MKTRHNTLLLALAFATGVTASASAFAQPADGQAGPGGGKHRGPPPEAVEACKGKAADAVCKFADREGRPLTGTCFAPPPPPDAAGKADAPARPLACRPARGPGSDKPKG